MLDTVEIERNEHKAFTLFKISLTAIILVLFAGVLMGIAIQNTVLINDIVLERGRSLFQQIVLTRRWAAEYGGVYVRKGPGVESNPYLLHPDLRAEDGSMLTLRNPASITREISEIATRQDGYRFRITSLKSLNPSNAPDDFERRSLSAFETGKTEVWETSEGPAGHEFRYMGALKTEASCLACHAVQGYVEGDVRGGISVRFEVETIQRKLAGNLAFIILAACSIAAATMAIVFSFIMRLRKELDRARNELAKAATTDALTGLYNRRYAMERFAQETEKALRSGSELSCAIIDADDFKSVNDVDGHLAGDLALKTLAAALLANARTYDIVSRYGGEEFLVLFPGIDAVSASAACDRFRSGIAGMTAAVLPRGRALTVSVGIADLGTVPPSTMETVRSAGGADGSDGSIPEGARPVAKSDAIIEAMLKNADTALYKAKAEGKDRCVVYR
ncbi:MAG: diguanylate cyclase [Spirochaetes bacterium]|nr:diguanylate cyclase [Spirochaetota bacterium]MBU1078987.1 diguanylate cyclase [Spirochaetota bacterium]